MAIATGRELRDGELAIFGVGLSMLADFFAQAHQAPSIRATTEGSVYGATPIGGLPGESSATDWRWMRSLGILRPHPQTREFFLDAYFPLSCVGEVRANTAWPLQLAPEARVIPEPTAGELAALRRVDETGMLRRGP